MSREIKEFDTWWMLQSKIPYRDKKEIARTSWYESQASLREKVIEAVNNIEGYTNECDPWAELYGALERKDAIEAIKQVFDNEDKDSE